MPNRARSSLSTTFALVPLATLSLLVLGSSPAYAERYDLRALLDRVRHKAPQVLVASEQVQVADTLQRTARRLWAPTGELTFGITGAPEVRCADATGYSDPNRSVREQNCVQTNVADLKNNSGLLDALPVQGVGLRLDARLLQPLYTFGKIEAARDAANQGRTVADAGVDQARADVTVLAQRAYYGLKWARAAGATLDEAIERLDGYVKKIEKELDSGKTSYTNVDLLRLKLAVEQIHLARLEVTKAGEIAQAGLKLLTQDPRADVDEAELEVPADPSRSREQYEESVDGRRPESRQLTAALRAARAQRKLRIAEMLPDVGIAASFNYAYASSVDDPRNSFFSRPNNLGFGLALVVRQQLDFGVRSGRYEQARAEERLAESKQKLAQAGMQLEVDRAFAEAKEARDRAVRTHRAERVARNWVNAVDQNLELGIGESRDLVDAARGYLEMRLRNLQAILDVHTTLAALQRASGELP